MAKHFIRSITPNHDEIRGHKYLRVFGTLLHDPNLWHLNRRSASGAFAVGLFFAFVPIPMQMVLAAAAAIFFRVNLPLSVALVWVTNPITIPPVFYFSYRIGTWVLHTPGDHVMTLDSLPDFSLEMMGDVWLPLLVGSLICGIVSSIVGYLAIRGLWRLHIINYIKQRKRERHLRSKITQARHP